MGRLAEALRESVRSAWAEPEASAAYVARHAQEMSAEVRRRHIDTYVNAFTLDVGEEGRAAARTLFERASARGLVPAVPERPFWGDAPGGRG